VRGKAGDDLLYGLDGNDSLDGGTGADQLFGGLGDDTYTVDNIGDIVTELPGEGTDSVYSSISWTIDANVERLYLTGVGTISATGDDRPNTLYGDSNTAGNELEGQEGDDSYYVGSGDVVIEAFGEGNDIVYSKISWTLGDNIERLYLLGSSTVSGTGNSLANALYSHVNPAANNLAGGMGNDIYQVGTNDTVTELAGQGTDTAYSQGSYTLGANVENLYLNVSAASTLTGNALGNALRGNSGSDTLLGLAGNDTLTGGLGNDTLTGGLDNDIFRFDSTPNASTNRDTITDFNAAGDDTIQFENAIFTSLTATGTLAAGSFISGAGLTSAADANDFVIYNSTTGALYYDAGGNTGAAAVQIAFIGIGLTLTNADFVVT